MTLDYQAGEEGGRFMYPDAGDPRPREGAKVQLLTAHGIHITGPWKDDGSVIGWLPLPKRDQRKEEAALQLIAKRRQLQKSS